jgi:lipopolysaccharide/colanic/teichoic acid biosynthesis glycosyltransferase
MRLIVIPGISPGNNPVEPGRLKQAMLAHPVSLLLTEAVRRTFVAAERAAFVGSDLGWVVPSQWDLPTDAGDMQILHEDWGRIVCHELGQRASGHPWLILSHGRFVTQTDASLVDEVLAEDHADVVAIRVSPRLRARQERVRLTAQGDLVGCRRLYRDAAEPTPFSDGLPHHLFIRTGCVERLLKDAPVRSLDDVLTASRASGLKIRSFAIAGTEIDLESPSGLQTMCGAVLSMAEPSPAVASLLYHREGGREGISPEARLVGPVLLGKSVRVDAGAVIVGPTVLCDGSAVGSQAFVDTSVVGEGVTVERDRRIESGCVLTQQEVSSRKPDSPPASRVSGRHAGIPPSGSEFRMWPRYSYARCLKRVADIIMSLFVIILFAPIIPFVALAIRLNSPGPVFYRDRRQGLHGRPFHCIKFRTMRVGAAEIQDKLRFISEVDGPQFKINDDPRISGVGRFLRDTSIDEIPQFFNVLAGQMSVVGPRPSPEAENTQCPSWRDARLSVRPGITGLWQVRRTRQPFKDFQEWIFYDTKYVRELSLRNDLWICVRTFGHLFMSFVEQF